MAVCIDDGFEGRKQLGYALHFIQDRATLQTRSEAGGICARGGERCGIVEGVIPIAASSAHLQGESGLPALPRTVDEDCRRVRERRDQGHLSEASVQGSSHSGQL